MQIRRRNFGCCGWQSGVSTMEVLSVACLVMTEHERASAEGIGSSTEGAFAL
jgi:hypothetical protein